MAILILQHSPHVGPGRIARVFRDLGFKLDLRRLDLVGDALGKPVGDPAQVSLRAGVPADYDNIEGIVTLGGEMNVTDTPRAPWMDRELTFLKGAHDRQIPIIGVCLGSQMLAAALGGKVAPMPATPGAPVGETGYQVVNVTVQGQTETMFAGVPWHVRWAQSHAQMVTDPPPGAAVLASSPACKIQAFRVGLRSYGFQFHIEAERGDMKSLFEGAPAGAIAPEAADGDQQYAGFDRVATRLITNLATYLIPFQSRMSA
jgi:GMP synthase (glutamine-hydrolysing)